MVNRNLALLVFVGVFGVFGACTYTPPGILQPTGDGGAGTGGDTSTSASVGGGGMGGSTGATGGSAGAGGGLPADWWDAAWSHRVRISFLNAAGGALTDFPVMVRLDESRSPNLQAVSTGADLRFIDDDGKTILPYEIDRWAPGGDSFIWVRVPAIDASDTDHIWLYYGNSAAPDAQDAKALWNDFIGVYHLSPDSSVPTQFADSAGTNPGAWNNNVPGVIVSGQINDAINLDGTTFVHIGDNGNVAADPGEARTAEAWINASKLQEQAIVYEEGQCVGWFLGMNANSEYLGSFITDSDGGPCDPGTVEYKAKSPASGGAWHYLTLVVDRPNQQMRLFVDGQIMTTTVIDNTGIADGNGVFRIGSDYNGGLGTFIGSIDEVRVSNGARRNGWIAAQYKSMTDNFLSFKPE